MSVNGPASIPAADFLSLPFRGGKPRSRGVTHMIDKGMPLTTLRSLLDLASDHIDFVKFGWGTSYLSRHIRSKVVACREYGVRACPGGTLLEIAAAQGKVVEFARWASSLGIDTVEISEGTIGLSRQVKRRLIEILKHDFCVLAEVGSKDPRDSVESAEWVSHMLDDLDAGASFVIAEGRESGTVGLYAADQSVRADLVDAIMAALPAGKLIFEAPVRSQQTWLIHHLGVDVNLGNVPPEEVLSLETLRRGLRSDTAEFTVPHPMLTDPDALPSLLSMTPPLMVGGGCSFDGPSSP